MPHVCMPPVCLYTCHVCKHPGVYTPPYSSVHVCFGGFACCGGCNSSPLCWDTFLTPPLFGGASPSITPPTLSYCSLCIGMFRDISMLCGHFPSVEGFGGVPTSVGGLEESALEMSICSFLYIFCSALCLTL